MILLTKKVALPARKSPKMHFKPKITRKSHFERPLQRATPGGMMSHRTLLKVEHFQTLNLPEDGRAGEPVSGNRTTGIAGTAESDRGELTGRAIRSGERS
jgi:hypothetical protein